MMNKFLKFYVIIITVSVYSKGQCAEVPQWFGHFSLAISHGLNYHLDGNRTIYWDDKRLNYEINNATSYAIAYRLTDRLSISGFRERFRGYYLDSIGLFSEDLITSRSGYNIGIAMSYKKTVSKRLSIIPRIGGMRRKGFEEYVFYPGIRGQIRTLELSDFGLTAGLTLDYTIGKGISVFALMDYTRFIYLKSDELGERDFYDGPTVNYVRTRIGLQYSFSHLAGRRSKNLNDQKIE